MDAQAKYYDYTPEKMLELLLEMKASGHPVYCFESGTGKPVNIDEVLKFYRALVK